MLLYHEALCHGRQDGEVDVFGCFPCHLCQARPKTRSETNHGNFENVANYLIESALCRHHLWEHIQTHSSCSRCPECYRVFPTAERLDRHRETSHGQPPSTGDSGHCVKLSTERKQEATADEERMSPGKRLCNISASAREQDQVLSCQDCGYTCRKRKLLALHRRRTHFAPAR